MEGMVIFGIRIRDFGKAWENRDRGAGQSGKVDPDNRDLLLRNCKKEALPKSKLNSVGKIFLGHVEDLRAKKKRLHVEGDVLSNLLET